MARTPKALRSTETPATRAGKKSTVADEASTPVRRVGRPKRAELSLEAPAGLNGTMGMEFADHAATDPVASEAPVQRRGGRKSKGADSSAATIPVKNDASPAGNELSHMSSEAEPVDAMPEPDGMVAGDSGALASSGSAAMAQSGSAVHWDRATDTVSFNWPEIERTAAQEGPNQGMAKLLTAARAEGANSRWPF